MKVVIELAEGIPGNTPVSVALGPVDAAGSARLVDEMTGEARPGQLRRDGDGAVLTWLEPAIDAGSRREYRVELGDGPTTADGVVLDEADGRLDVQVGGALFTSYHFGADVYRPFLHPVIGPSGDSVVRGYPLVTGVPGETTDHVHHRGIWTGHGMVNGVDNWKEEDDAGRTVHRRFESLESGPVYGRAVALADWVDHDSSRLLTERRELTFYATSLGRLFDYDVTLTASEGDVLIGADKEVGWIALRVATSMDVDNGGRLENSEGGVGEVGTWGQRAAWCDYSGDVQGRRAGVAILDHPGNPRHPTFWHARNYGLVTTNPFGTTIFPGEGEKSDYLLRSGESLGFRYRVYVHEGDASGGGVAAYHRVYSDAPVATLS